MDLSQPDSSQPELSQLDSEFIFTLAIDRSEDVRFLIKIGFFNTRLLAAVVARFSTISKGYFWQFIGCDDRAQYRTCVQTCIRFFRFAIDRCSCKCCPWLSLYYPCITHYCAGCKTTHQHNAKDNCKCKSCIRIDRGYNHWMCSKYSPCDICGKHELKSELVTCDISRAGWRVCNKCRLVCGCGSSTTRQIHKWKSLPYMYLWLNEKNRYKSMLLCSDCIQPEIEYRMLSAIPLKPHIFEFKYVSGSGSYRYDHAEYSDSSLVGYYGEYVVEDMKNLFV